MKIQIRISKVSNVPATMLVDGVKGRGCLLATKKLREQTVGAKALEHTDEYVQEGEATVAVSG